jgi:hypothetical protein
MNVVAAPLEHGHGGAKALNDLGILRLVRTRAADGRAGRMWAVGTSVHRRRMWQVAS